MNKPGQVNRGKGRGGVKAIVEKGKDVKEIVEKGKDVKRTESPMSVLGRGQASSSPMSEDGNDKEILNRICQLHQQIRADHKPVRADHKPIMSAIVELKTEIENLIYELDDSEENIEEQKNPAKSKPVVLKATESGTNKSKDLYTVATTTKMKCRKLNSDLVKTRKELKEISELAVAVEQDVGFQPETSRSDRDKDSLSFNAKGALEDIKRMNKELSKELNKLSQNIERYSTDQPEQQRNDKNQQPNSTRQQLQTANQAKKTKDQSEEKKDHNSSKFDTNLEIISKAVRSFDDLQLYKRELDKISELAVTVGQEVAFQPDTSKTDKDKEGLSCNATKALKYIKQRNTKLNQQLDILRKKITTNPTCLNAQQQPEEKQQKEKKIPKSTQKGTDKPNPVKDQRQNKEDRNENREGKKETREAKHEASGQISPVQFDTNLQIVSETVEYVGNLQNNKIAYEQMLKHVWKTTNTAAIHVKELISNNKGPDKFQIVKVGEVQSDEIDHFNQLVVNMIKTIEGFVDTRSGLSKIAGNKMTEGNPNIATLGDPNRPTKIAEVYSEIYDNEWTDTLDFCLKELGKEYSENEALQALNKTLIICYKICQEKSDEWMQKTKEMLQRCSRELMVNFQSDEILMQIIEGRKVDPDKRSQQLLKEIRPKKDLVATKYDKEMNSSKLYKMIIQNKFFEKCFTLCWKMIVQNPRMILVEGPSKGETYDRNIFREFTSSGSKVVFTVWPALYLHEDGPLLVKGVLRVE